MRRKMMVILGLCVALSVGWTLLAADSADMAIDIVVAPSTLVMGSEGVWVTVHADIPYSSVAGMTVTLNGLEVDYTKADNRGDLVAKFEIDAVKGIVAPPSAELTLSGMTTSGVVFSGTDSIRVLGPRGK